MMKNWLRIVLLIAVSVVTGNSWASDFKDEGRPTDIQVEIAKVTQVEFPSKVAKVVKGGDPESILVEVLDNSVYLLPKTESPSDIFVTTTSGSSYPLNLHVGADHDIKIKVGSFKNREFTASSGYYSDVMDLMKELLQDHEPAGATILPAKGQVLLSNQQIKLTVDKAFELPSWKAYVLVAQNLIKNAVIIPVEQMSLPNLLAVSSQRDMLAAQGLEGDQSKIYMIIGKSNEDTGI